MSKKILQAAAGAGGESVYVDDVFSTYLYDGNGSTQTITNGIDLSGEGGLVWSKWRSGYYTTRDHNLFDTERGTSNYLNTNLSNAENTSYTNVITYNSNGFTWNQQFPSNMSFGGETFVSWSFRKQAGFFDVVTWTGDGTNDREISHNLGSVPGFIIIKSTSNSTDWITYHRSYTYPQWIRLNSTDAQSTTYGSAWSSSNPPTSTGFTLGSGGFGDVNYNGRTYVAYLFAHDDQSFGDNSDESIIKCGSLVSGTVQDIDLGWEPQFIIYKNASSTGGWTMFDVMRGMTTDGSGTYIQANTTAAEATASAQPSPLANGFRWNYTGNSGNTFIYIAIRRPMKTPEAGTDVFSPYSYSDTGLTSGGITASNRTMINGGANGGSGFPVDVFWHKATNNTSYGVHMFDRLRGQGKSLLTNQSNAEPAGDGASNSAFDFQEGVDAEYNGAIYYYTTAAGNRNHITYHLKRATGFMDVVAYTGTGSATTVEHNLGVAPEFLIIKRRDASGAWKIGTNYYNSGTNPWQYELSGWSEANSSVSSSSRFNNTAPTESVFSVSSDSNVNASGGTYIAYMFATLEGISKVGTYTGTGSDVTVDCGFSSTARFVLIKDLSTSSRWYVFDSERGITSSTDPAYQFGRNAAQFNNATYDINPASSGFLVPSGASNLNTSSRTYLFLAIA